MYVIKNTLKLREISLVKIGVIIGFELKQLNS